MRTSNSMKIRSVGAKLLHVGRRTDGRTDMTKLTVAFRNFYAPINGFIKRSVRTLNRNGSNFFTLNQAFPCTGEATIKVRTTVCLQIIKMLTDSASDTTFKEMWSSSFDSKVVTQTHSKNSRKKINP